MFQVITILFINETSLRKLCKIWKRSGESGRKNVVRGLFFGTGRHDVRQFARQDALRMSLSPHVMTVSAWLTVYPSWTSSIHSFFPSTWLMNWVVDAWWASLLSYSSLQTEKCIYVQFILFFFMVVTDWSVPEIQNTKPT